MDNVNLHNLQAHLQKQATQFQAAADALAGLTNGTAPAPRKKAATPGPKLHKSTKRHLSPAAIASIRRAQQVRWAKWRKQNKAAAGVSSKGPKLVASRKGGR